MMKKTISMIGAMIMAMSVVADIVGVAPTVTMTSWTNGTKVTGPVLLNYYLLDAEDVTVSVDGAAIMSATNSGSFYWTPQTTGNHTLTHTAGTNVWSVTVNVTNVGYWVQATPNPPMSPVSTISITPTTRSIPQTGGGNAINTSGSGNWTAAVSDDWITLKATSGAAGSPVAYTVSLNPNVEERVGYVYVAGYTHTITQAGVGGSITPTNAEFEYQGGSGQVTVTAQNRMGWHARSNVDWVSVTPVAGEGEQTVTYTVAPWNEVSTRSGTLTIAGNTFTVFQYGLRMKLSSYSATCDYYTHVVPVTVNALAITQWSVTPNNSWLSVVDGGNGRGGDTVTIAVAENPSYAPRTGTVTIGTETFTITQEGRTDLVFTISPETTTASVNGANGLIAVNATPDLPWTAASQANWLTVMTKFQKGAGNGNVVYTVSPNPTLSKRTGKITVTPVSGCGMPTRTHTVTQPAAQATLDRTAYTFEAAGESVAVMVTTADIVEWQVTNLPSWLTASGTAFVGPGTVTLQASANDTVYPRTATIKIAERSFKVVQNARGVELEYDTILFGEDGGMESVSIHPDGNVAWTAVSSDPSWIIIYSDESGTGDTEILYIVAPYTGTGEARTGTITIGDKVVYITQRAYDLNIDPYAEWVNGNSGAGEIGVSAAIGDVWNAIATEPWITIVTGYDSGTGSGVVRFTYTENDTGKQRTGKIVIAGEVYTLTQAARVMVDVSATVQGGGTVSGAGSYVSGTEVTLTAIPDDGYEFLYWTGDRETMQNPITVTADVAKRLTAVFGALTPEFTDAVSDVTGVTLTWRNLAWATEYRIYRAPTSEFVGEVLVTLTGNGAHSFKDTTGEVGKTYWYWVEAVGADVTTESKQPATGAKAKPIVYSPIVYENLKGAAHTNPTTYEEGKQLAFAVPGAVTGYTFARWEPAMITAEMTGAQTVRAVWDANTYAVKFNANGGSGTMDDLAMVYDAEAVALIGCGFTRAGYRFAGWATEPDGAVVYADGAAVRNLAATQGAVVELFAVWELTGVPVPVVTPSDGSVFTDDSCTVTITCDLAGAEIYYTTDGKTPKTTASYRYNGPFAVSGSVNIKAVAVYESVKSAYVTAAITKKTLTLANVLGLGANSGVTLTTGGDKPWLPVADEDAKMDGDCAVSGAIDDDEVSWLEATVNGAGTLTFWWKCSCEQDEDNTYSWDHLAYSVDGVEQPTRIDGETDWKQVTVTFTAPGTHKVRWMYVKDASDSDGADCAWVDGVVWSGAEVPPTPAEPTVGDGQGTVIVIAGDAVVEPLPGVTENDVALPDGFAGKVVVPPSVDVVRGVAAIGQVAVRFGETDLTPLLELSVGVDGVTVGDVKESAREQVFSAAAETDIAAKVLDLDGDAEITTAVPGLYYTVEDGDSLAQGLVQTADSVQAGADGKVKLPRRVFENAGFYRVRVSRRPLVH